MAWNCVCVFLVLLIFFSFAQNGRSLNDFATQHLVCEFWREKQPDVKASFVWSSIAILRHKTRQKRRETQPVTSLNTEFNTTYIQYWICISTPRWKFKRFMQSRIPCFVSFLVCLFRFLLSMPKVWNYFELCSSTIALFPLETSVSNWVICDCDDHII